MRRRLPKPAATGLNEGLFERFIQSGYELDVVTRDDFHSGEVTGPPASPESAYEWRALLDAIDEASRTFTMVELGAGYGRWTISAARSIRLYRPNLRYRLIAVEAEPTHAAWLRLHARDNGVRRISRAGTFKAIEAAVSGTGPSRQSFFGGNPREWYGQTLVRPENAGWDGPAIEVPTVHLSRLVAMTELVDLLHLDIQGLELEVLTEAMEALGGVRRIYVETHSAEVDAALPGLFERAAGGWSPVAIAPLGSRTTTPLGDAHFALGGAQLWKNEAPRRRQS